MWSHTGIQLRKVIAVIFISQVGISFQVVKSGAQILDGRLQVNQVLSHAEEG